MVRPFGEGIGEMGAPRSERRLAAVLAATFAHMGNALAAAAHAAEALKREPQFSVAAHLATQHYKRKVDRRRHEAGLLKAGLPI